MNKNMMRLTAALAGLCLGLANGVQGAGDSKPVDVSGYPGPIRLACIGDSITAGVKAKGAAYPDVLMKVLGDQWQVHNFGVSGATMLRKDGASFSAKPQYAKALDLKPDVATIALGTNDSKLPIGKDNADFEADYKAMIAELRKANPKVIIYCCLPPPAFPGKWGIKDAVIKGEIIPLILKVAQDTGCNVIDLYAALDGKKELVPDTVHPGPDGQKRLAAAVYEALTGKKIPAEVGKAAPATGTVPAGKP